MQVEHRHEALVDSTAPAVDGTAPAVAQSGNVEAAPARLAVEYRPAAGLIPYARNARTHSDAQVAQIAASIREFGWTNPVLVDGDNGIIAGLIGIDPKTLRKHYRQGLDHCHTKANARVAENLFRKATGDGRESVTAAIFWLKARARWKETTLNEHTGIDGKPIEQVSEIRRIIISAPERATGLPGSPALPAPDISNGSVTVWGQMQADAAEQVDAAIQRAVKAKL
jgi:hypothetical protein